MNFYKNVIEHRGKLLIRGVFNGKDYSEKLDFSPILYALTQEESEYKTKTNLVLLPLVIQTRSCNKTVIWFR